MSIIQSLEDAQRVFGELDMWTKAWTDCDGVIRWAENGQQAFKVSHEIEEEEAAEDADIVFKCEACSISIVRNSRAHDHCICDEDGERWWCEDCYDHYQQDGWSYP